MYGNDDETKIKRAISLYPYLTFTHSYIVLASEMDCNQTCHVCTIPHCCVILVKREHLGLISETFQPFSN
jgi:hypothetical protein